MLRFGVIETTRFHSRDGAIDSLEDVLPGMLAGVAAVAETDGSLTAVNLVLGSPDDLPVYDQRRSGRIVSVGNDGFVLKARNGEQITLAVDEETIYRGGAGKVQGLQDIKPGMAVLVGMDNLNDGRYLARLVAVGRH